LINTGLFKMIAGVLTTCHTQYTPDSSICVFLFNGTTLQVFVTYLTGALYVYQLWFYRVIRNDCRGFNNCHTQYTWDGSICFFNLIEKHSKFLLHTIQVLYMCTNCDSTGLFKMIAGVLTTCHTQYTSDSSICIFYLIERHSKFLLHNFQLLYMCTLCDSTNINTIIEFVPNCL